MNLRPIEVALSVEESTNSYPLTTEDSAKVVPMSVSDAIVTSNLPDYEGEYNVTPTTEDQVLATADKRLLLDITVAAIPNNYGLITYNGAVITVS